MSGRFSRHGQARGFTLAASTFERDTLAKPNYSFEKRQRELANKKKQEEKDAKKRAAREAAQPASDADHATAIEGSADTDTPA